MTHALDTISRAAAPSNARRAASGQIWLAGFLRRLETRGVDRPAIYDKLAGAYGEIALAHKARGDRRGQGAAAELAAEYRRKAQRAEINARIKRKGRAYG